LMLDSQVFKDEGDMGFCEDYWNQWLS
jgi:hypothetical protein